MRWICDIANNLEAYPSPTFSIHKCEALVEACEIKNISIYILFFFFGRKWMDL